MHIFGLKVNSREIALPKATAEVVFVSDETNASLNYTTQHQCALARERRSINQREPQRN
jgi:hypothetical protein